MCRLSIGNFRVTRTTSRARETTTSEHQLSLPPQMSARQPFVPSRPASRTVNPGDDASATSGGSAARAGSTNPLSDVNGSAELAVK